ncbi:MAG: DNA cytosine methyltransferase [Proteobacteria bacterium]|nr:DNA cytosine methyltransferase [Pseudomonadota bacterium]MDA1023567.1 DNA cytosine methyltransferase [Pseudomonadota bacterium]
MKSVELFAGAGGLGMGVGLSGFEPSLVIERDQWACGTLRENAERGYPLVKDWPLIEDDVRNFDFQSLGDGIHLVVAGPPCQPFSMGGKHQAYQDDRDMFPATVDVIRQLRPQAFIIENVKGLTRSAFQNYFQYIVLQLAFPENKRRKNEDWGEHLARLEKRKTSGVRRGLSYEIVCRVLNAANFGVPQKRERVFIVGFRNDLGIRWSFPDESHSLDSLLLDKWVTGEYWDRHKISKRNRPPLPDRLAKRVEKAKKIKELQSNALQPWRTVRDALVGLPEPNKNIDNGIYLNHGFQSGARQYPGHTGSPMDMPAKALKAGAHGVPGGENMIVLPDGKVRYFTVREAARIQTFPDGYVFHGAWSEMMRQLGNAVPVELARVVATSVAEKLLESEAARLEKFCRQSGES